MRGVARVKRLCTLGVVSKLYQRPTVNLHHPNRCFLLRSNFRSICVTLLALILLMSMDDHNGYRSVLNTVNALSPRVCDACKSLNVQLPPPSSSSLVTTNVKSGSVDETVNQLSSQWLDGGKDCVGSSQGNPNITITYTVDNVNEPSSMYLNGCRIGIEFCGNDGKCHKNSCTNLYQYGNEFYTGVVAGSSISSTTMINCTSVDQIVQSIDEEVAEFPVSILYSCAGSTSNDARTEDTNEVIESSYSLNTKRQNQPICLANDEVAASNSQFFTQICRAYPAEDRTFTCYDLNPETDLTQYKLSTINSTGYGCSSSNPAYDNSSTSEEAPYHRYGINLARVDYTPESFGCTKMSTSQSSLTVEQELAFGTLASVLIIGKEPNYTNPSLTEPPSATPIISGASFRSDIINRKKFLLQLGSRSFILCPPIVITVGLTSFLALLVL